jgi:hypothetical protein
VNKIASLLTMLVLLLPGAGCKKEDVPELGREFTLRPERSAQFGTLQITLVELKDSRCPSDFVCVHGGWAFVRVRLSKGPDGTEVCLGCLEEQNGAVGPVPTRTVTLGRETYEITFKAIAPRASTQPDATVDVTFVVTRK